MPDTEPAREAKDVKVYQIGEVVERTGLTHRTLRYYEEIGLMGQRDHQAGKHRVYTEEDLERISRILRFKEILGHSLSEIKAVIELDVERQALREETRGSLGKRERVQKLQRLREIFLAELEIVKDRKRRIAEVEDLIQERVAGIDEELESLQ